MQAINLCRIIDSASLGTLKSRGQCDRFQGAVSTRRECREELLKDVSEETRRVKESGV